MSPSIVTAPAAAGAAVAAAINRRKIPIRNGTGPTVSLGLEMTIVRHHSLVRIGNAVAPNSWSRGTDAGPRQARLRGACQPTRLCRFRVRQFGCPAAVIAGCRAIVLAK